MASPNTTQLQFCPFNSALDTGFWYKLSEKKLNEYGLDDKSKPLEGYYCNGEFSLECDIDQMIKFVKNYSS